jgi:hypothetical protein
MRKITPQPKGVLNGFLNAEQTNSFLKDLDGAIKTLEQLPVKRVLLEYGVLMQEEVLEFQKAHQDLIEKLNKHDKGFVAVRNVKTRESRCIACEYGKDMTVYEFEYYFPEADEKWYTVVYKYEFGVLHDLKDGELCDLRICNAFLSQCEMLKLNS